MSIVVVIPAHNEEQYIGNCLKSLQFQTTPPKEILVVADGCTDNTEHIASKYAEVLSLKRSQGYGVGMARNLNNARKYLEKRVFEYFMVLDADHILDANYIEECLKAFDKNTVIVGGQTFGMEHYQPRGAHRIYKKWWLDLNPFPNVKSWDSYHFYLVYFDRLQHKLVKGVYAYEKRPQGGSLLREVGKGYDSYRLGYSLPYLFLRSVRSIVSRRVLTGLVMPFGFFHALGKRVKKHPIAAKVNLMHRQRVKSFMMRHLPSKGVIST